MASSRWLEPGTGQEKVSSGSAIERFFPLVDGMVYTYETETELADKGLLVARVHRSDATHGEPPLSQRREALRARADRRRNRVGRAVAARAIFVLKLPLQVGASWRGEHGGQTRVMSITETIKTPAGDYAGLRAHDRGAPR